jgi:transcriptional regulator with XRE-family HTH domain
MRARVQRQTTADATQAAPVAPPAASAPASIRPDRDGTWRALLRSERLRLRLTQTELARRVGLSAETVRKYEAGTRTPDRDHLDRLLVALEVSQPKRRAALESAGFIAPSTLFGPANAPFYYFTVPELRAFVEGVPWPQFVTDNLCQVVVANRAAGALWGVDVAAELARRARPQINLLSIAAERQFSQRVANWDEAVAILISIVKALPEGGSTLDDLGPLFLEVLDAFAANDPTAVPRLLALWERTPVQTAKVRWMYPIDWVEPGVGELHFRCLVSIASEPDCLFFNDWIPLDPTTLERLDRVKQTGRPGHL